MAPRPAQRFSVVVALLLTCAAAIAAQSGRRSTAKPPTPPPPSTTAAESSSTKPTESDTKAPPIQLLAGIDDPSPLSGIPRSFADTVLDACVRRLSQPAGVRVTAGPRTLTRGDAVKAAKSETARYVVWLQVGNSSVDSGRQASGDANEYYVSFMLLEPATAKVKQSGRVFGGGRKVGNVGVGVPSSSGSLLYLEQVIKDDARQEAERILSALGIKDSEWPRE